jgi:glycerol 2-dehydrogenase (NADP+)
MLNLMTLETLFRLLYRPAIGISMRELLSLSNSSAFASGILNFSYFSAQAYGNQTAVGDGVMLACVPRETLFLTTKVDNVNHKCVAESIELSLFRLHVDYIDLVLMHSPVSIGT